MARVRIRFAKLGKIRWTSHRDVARMWERAFRKVQLPLAYSSGFSPRPKISFGLALPTGHESLAEYLDVELAGDPPEDLDSLRTTLSEALPAGVDVVATAVLDAGEPSLQQQVIASSWSMVVGGCMLSPVEVSERVGHLLASDSVVVSRQRKGEVVTDDIRPSVIAARVIGPATDGSGVGLECELATQPRSLRPEELVVALGTGLEARQVRRLHQWIERDGARREPLPLLATAAPHAVERAS